MERRLGRDGSLGLGRPSLLSLFGWLWHLRRVVGDDSCSRLVLRSGTILLDVLFSMGLLGWDSSLLPCSIAVLIAIASCC